MVLEKKSHSLTLKQIPVPSPGTGQILIKVKVCGVCRTDLHIVDGELPDPKLPLVPGHEVIGQVVTLGPGCAIFSEGDVVGVAWLGYTCNSCEFCLHGSENLCDKALFTGYTLDGGFAEYILANEGYCYPIPTGYANAAGAPLMCAGLIGYRSYQMISSFSETIGFYGFGAAAHILVQIAVAQKKKVFAFTREGDRNAQSFALESGAVWCHGSETQAPEKLDAALIFAPAGNLVPKALTDIRKGGTVVCGGIHMSDIPSFPYRLLWGEKTLRSVANLTRKDGIGFFETIDSIPVQTETKIFPLEMANSALEQLRSGGIRGAAVLEIG